MSEVTYFACVYRDGDEIIAFSPVCKHLGCTVTWAADDNNPERFFCPCHNGLYEKNGENVPGTPPTGPLRSEERRVGKECRTGGWRGHERKRERVRMAECR